MLVLSRRLQEDLIIAGRIVVKVVAVEGNRVKLGVVAPDSVSVVRRELLSEAEQAAAEAAALQNDEYESLDADDKAALDHWKREWKGHSDSAPIA